MRRTDFYHGGYYHIVNRGVENRVLFTDDTDFVRFLEYMRRFRNTKEKPYLDEPARPLVTLVAYVLVPGSFEILLRQEEDEGVTDFMHQLGTGYSMYFNRKVARRGRLFEGPFLATELDGKEELLRLSKTIHLLPVGESVAPKERTRQLRQYKWSSYPDLIGLRDGTLCDKKVLWSLLPAGDPHVRYREYVEGE